LHPQVLAIISTGASELLIFIYTTLAKGKIAYNKIFHKKLSDFLEYDLGRMKWLFEYE
jgi:hypothetical protein